MIDLGALSGGHSGAGGINNLGQVVGYSFMADSRTHATLYENCTLFDLNSLAASLLSDGTNPGFLSLLSAGDINDAGLITGSGVWFDGTNTSQRAFLLDLERPGTVPDHGSPLSLLALGLSALFFARRKTAA